MGFQEKKGSDGMALNPLVNQIAHYLSHEKIHDQL